MIPFFIEVTVDLSRMRNGCGTKQFPLTAEQVIDLHDALQDCRNIVLIDDNEITLGSCTASEVNEIIGTIENTIMPHGYMMTDAVRCTMVRDLNTDGCDEVAGPTDLTGFEESDWTDEEESE